MGEDRSDLHIVHNKFSKSWREALTSTTGTGPSADGHIYADGPRRPCLRYADNHIQAVGVIKPSGYSDLCRRPPSAQNGRRLTQTYAYSRRRHISAVGIVAGPAIPP